MQSQGSQSSLSLSNMVMLPENLGGTTEGRSVASASITLTLSSLFDGLLAHVAVG